MTIAKQGCDWPYRWCSTTSREGDVARRRGNARKEPSRRTHSPDRMKGVKVIDNTKGQVIDLRGTLGGIPE